MSAQIIILYLIIGLIVGAIMVLLKRQLSAAMLRRGTIPTFTVNDLLFAGLLVWPLMLVVVIYGVCSAMIGKAKS